MNHKPKTNVSFTLATSSFEEHIDLNDNLNKNESTITTFTSNNFNNTSLNSEDSVSFNSECENENRSNNPLDKKYFLSSNQSLNDSISSASNTASMVAIWKNDGSKKTDSSLNISCNTEALALSPATAPKRLNKFTRNVIATNKVLNNVQQNAQKLGKEIINKI